MVTNFSSEIINRKKYLEKVSPFIDKSLIKVFTGQRRVGKSYLLYQLMGEIQTKVPNHEIIYINKEDLAFDSIKNATDLNGYVEEKIKKEKKHYLFIDEIQEINDFEKALRSLLLKKDIDIYCTGSNAKLLSGELASLLSGRFVEFQVHSLSYPEFLIFHKTEDSDETLEKYIKYGGLPYLMHLPLEDIVIFEYIKNIYSTIVYKDVISRYNIRNARILEKLVQFLANNTGSLFSAKRISDFLKSQNIKIAPNQIQNYIEYLLNAFIIHRSERYDIVGRKIFETGAKYYFENLGIRNSIWGYKPEDRGKILENMVYNHLVWLGYEIKTGNLNTEEIDFVCDRQGERIYVQVALRLDTEETKKREFGNLLKIKDNYKKYVITFDKFSGNTYQGIEHKQIREFLMNDI